MLSRRPYKLLDDFIQNSILILHQIHFDENQAILEFLDFFSNMLLI